MQASNTLSKKQYLKSFLFIAFSFVIGISMCGEAQKDTSEETKKPISSDVNLKTIGISLLDGIWGQQIGENANFEISGDSIYYPDADRRLYFKINDSTMTVYEENGDYSFKSKIIHVNQDSLIMASDGAEKLVFLKFK